MASSCSFSAALSPNYRSSAKRTADLKSLFSGVAALVTSLSAGTTCEMVALLRSGWLSSKSRRQVLIYCRVRSWPEATARDRARSYDLDGLLSDRTDDLSRFLPSIDFLDGDEKVLI